MGRIHLFSGRDGHRLYVRSGAGYGRLIAAAGDQDGDRAADLVVTSFDTARSLPIVHVLSGRTGCSIRELQNPFEAERPCAGCFGSPLAAGLDIDGDGLTDILIGAPCTRAGSVVAFSGKDGHVITRIAGDDSCPASERDFGSSLCAMGDIDGDGRTDFAVRGSIAEQENGQVSDFIRVISVASMRTLSRPSTDPYDEWAEPWSTIASAGDVDDDGAIDLAVVELDHRVLLFSGKDGRKLREILAPDGYRFGFGASIAEVGDLDGDGRPELAIGCSGFGPDSGDDAYVAIFSGQDGGLLARYDTSQEPVVVAAGFDWSGDGIPDVLFGLPGIDQVVAISGQLAGQPKGRLIRREEWDVVRVLAPPLPHLAGGR